MSKDHEQKTLLSNATTASGTGLIETVTFPLDDRSQIPTDPALAHQSKLPL